MVMPVGVVMRMPVVQVGIMGMAMHQLRVPVAVGVGLPRRIVGAVKVLVVGIMHMAVGMFHLLMFMNMGVAFAQVQP